MGYRPVIAEAKNNPSDLLSAHIQMQSNTPDSILLEWDFSEPPVQAEHTVLLFAHGAISSASYFVRSYEWFQYEGGEKIQTGTHEDLPEEWKRRVPSLQLQEFGFMGGSRVVRLTLRFQLQAPSRQSGETVIEFPKGEVEIRFGEQDPLPFAGFSKALNEAAQAVFVNSPPLTRIESESLHVVEAYQNESLPYLHQAALRLITRDEGLYDLSGGAVLEGLGISVLQRNHIALWRGLEPIPRVIVDEEGWNQSDGILQPSDRIRIFSPESQSAFSPEVVTWLTVHPDSVVQPEVLKLAPQEPASHILHRRIHLEEDVFHITGRKRNEEQNAHWMWHSFAEGVFSKPFAVHEVTAEATAVFRIRLDIKNPSYSIQAQHVQAQINHITVRGEVHHSGENQFTFEGQLPASAIVAHNTIDIAIQKAFQQSNAVNLDAVDLFYPISIQPSNRPFQNPLHEVRIAVPEGSRSVWSIHPDSNSHRIYYHTGQVDSGYGVQDQHHEALFYFLPQAAELPAPTASISIPPDQRTLSTRSTPQADIIILSPRKWLPLLDPYRAALRSQSLSSAVIAAEDVYDTFGDGSLSPQSLRDFLRYAYHTWDSPKPSYVLLIGDATWDYRGRYQNGIVNELPSYQGDENYAIEHWYVRVDRPEDPLPDMVIARIPVRTDEELQTVMDKTLAYRNEPPLGDWFNKTLVLTDNEFELYTEEVLTDWLPKGIQTYHRHIADYPLVDNIYLPARLRAKMRAKTSLAATEDLIDILSDGVFLWQFFGHGAPNVMGKERLFFGGGSKFSDVKKLARNQKPHVLWSFSCETTRFDYPLEKWNISIGEDLLTLPGGGAIALMGATGRGYPQDHILLARGLHEAAFDYGLSTFGLQYYTGQLLGQAFKPGYEPIDQFAIFGDPALPMPRFVGMDGTLTQAGSSYDIEFASNPRFSQPFSGYTWYQNHDRSRFEYGEADHLNGAIPIQMGIKPEVLQPFYPGKIGFHLIQKENERIVVGHGGVDIPDPKSASTFVAPSTGVLPDLRFISGILKIHPDSPRSGETLFLEAELINTGKASARNVSVQAFRLLENGNEVGLETLVGKKIVRVSELNPGESQPVRLRWDGTANDGTHTLRIKADPHQLIEEADEDNNAIETEMYIRKKADLVLGPDDVDIQLSPDGQKRMVSFQVRNQGESTAERVRIEFKLVLNGKEIVQNFPVDPETRRFTPGTIEPGGVYPPKRNPVGIPAAIESFTITVDPDEVVDEETHENNIFTYTPN